MIDEYLITEEEEFKVLRDRYNFNVVTDDEIRNNIKCIRKKIKEVFIDRDELKDKINYIINENSKKWELIKIKEIDGLDSYEIKDIQLLKLKKEILELLED